MVLLFDKQLTEEWCTNVPKILPNNPLQVLNSKSFILLEWFLNQS